MPGAIRRAIGVDISARCQALGDAIGHAQPAAGDVRAVHEQVGEPAVAGARRVPVAQQHAVGSGRGVQHDLTAFRDQHPRAGSALAGFHVLGEDQKLVARGLDDRVQIAAQNERRRLQRLFIRDLDDVDARAARASSARNRLRTVCSGRSPGTGLSRRRPARPARYRATRPSRARSSCGNTIRH